MKQIKRYLKRLFDALRGIEPELPDVEPHVVRVAITPELVQELRTTFPVVMYKKDRGLPELAQSAGEQRVVDFLERKMKPYVRGV